MYNIYLCTSNSITTGTIYFLETKYFPDLGVINPAANGFKLGVLENVHARPASFTAPYTQMKQRFTRI